MKKRKNLDLEVIKERLYKKYSSYDIPLFILENTFNKVKNDDDEISLIFNFYRQMDQYLINEIKSDNIDAQIKIIDNNFYLKRMIVKNPKYNINKETIDTIYEDAIELLKERYDSKKLLNNNIIYNMQYIIVSRNLQKNEDDYNYDISFLKKYLVLYGIEYKDYADLLDCDLITFNLLLDGKKKLSRRYMCLLCHLFNVNSYDELKDLIKDKIDFYIYKEELIKKHRENKKLKLEFKKERNKK